MEKPKTKKKKRLIPNIILLFVLISSTLIMVEVFNNIKVEMDSRNRQVVVNSTLEPTSVVSPTPAPFMTSEPIIDA